MTTRLQILARTKTVATIGPASNTEEMLQKLIEAGANIFRLNMAHGSQQSHAETIEKIRSASKSVGLPIGILVDLAGPKIRLGQLAADPLLIETGQQLRFVRGSQSSSMDELTCTYESLVDEVKTGDSIVLADGALRLEVTDSQQDQLICVASDGGTVRSRQGVNLPATELSVPALGPVDIDNANWACKNGADFISISFVRNVDEVNQLRKIIIDNGSEAHIVAKIEKREAIDRLDEIIQATDAVMVARGDLGVEIDIEKTPLAQKKIIKTCLEYSKPVIVATQMLESMHSSKQPTRAEVSDVANAILDGADACMLSGETAIGEFPIDAVKMMNKIKVETETMLSGRASKIGRQRQEKRWSISESVVFGSAQVAKRIGANVVFIASSDSNLPLVKSKQRDYIPTVCITDCEITYRRMSLYWSVVPVLVDKISTAELSENIKQWAIEKGGLSKGDRYVAMIDTEILPGIFDTIMVSEI